MAVLSDDVAGLCGEVDNVVVLHDSVEQGVVAAFPCQGITASLYVVRNGSLFCEQRRLPVVILTHYGIECGHGGLFSSQHRIVILIVTSGFDDISVFVLIVGVIGGLAAIRVDRSSRRCVRAELSETLGIATTHLAPPNL